MLTGLNSSYLAHIGRNVLHTLVLATARLVLLLSTAALLTWPGTMQLGSLSTASLRHAPAVTIRAENLGCNGDLSGGVQVQYQDGTMYKVWAVTPLSARWPSLQDGPPLAEQLKRVRNLQQRQKYPPHLTPTRNVFRLKCM